MTFHRLISFILTMVLSMLFLTACKENIVNNTMKAPTANSTKDTTVVLELLNKANTFTQNNFDSLRYYADQALTIAREIQFTEAIGRARGMEANYQRRKGNYEGAINISLEVIDLYDSLKLWIRVVKMKNFLADIYKEMGGEKGTMEYLKKGLELSKQAEKLAEKEKYIAGITMSLNEQGIILRDISKENGRKDLMDSAFFLYKKAIELINKTGEAKEDLSKLYNNASQIYNEHYKDYAKALEYQMLAVQINTKENNKSSLTHNYNTISDIYRNKRDFDLANLYAHKTLQLCIELKAPFRIVNAYHSLVKVHKETGRYDSALYFAELGTVLSDSLNNVEKAKQIAESQTKYDTGKKEDRITHLDKINQSNNQRLWMAGGLISLFGVLIGISVFQNRRLRKQKAQITEQSNRLQWMMKELHHRVKNNLQIVSSLLNLQTYRLKDEESVTALKESQLRVQAMSLIHQRLYQVDDVSMVNFKLYLDDLVETLMRSYGYGADDFDLKIVVEKELLDVDTVMPMGLLVNEIITNSFKYAYTNVKRPLLHINLISANQQLELTIKDNGPGLDTATAEQSKQGFGKKLISALSKQLKATWSVDGSTGTSYQFTIPENKEKAA